MIRPTPEDFVGWLRPSLTVALEQRYGRLELSPFREAPSVADGTTVLLASDDLRRPRAVVLCSSPAAPNMVERAMIRAQRARAVLDARSGDAILRPLAEGRVQGLSYAVLPYCRSLNDRGFGWRLQRVFLRSSVLRWLLGVAKASMREVPDVRVQQAFIDPLERLARIDVLGESINNAARRAIEQLGAGSWKPRFVLMHGDLWQGNILIRPKDMDGDPRLWQNRFAVIDWAGSEVEGFAIYDLLRIARSLRLDRGALRREVRRHCELLGCELLNAQAYLMAALAHIAANLEHFPIDRFVRMAKSCVTDLDEIVA